MGKYGKCIRCGLCCAVCDCSYGERDGRGLCRFLQIERVGTSCIKMLNGTIPPHDDMRRSGCFNRDVLGELFELIHDDYLNAIQTERERLFGKEDTNVCNNKEVSAGES